MYNKKSIQINAKLMHYTTVIRAEALCAAEYIYEQENDDGRIGSHRKETIKKNLGINKRWRPVQKTPQ